MPTHRLTDTEIAIRIVPKHVRWPERGTNLAWTGAHACVDALQDLVRKVDAACVGAEQDRDLAGAAIARRRTEICNQALSKLVNFRPFEVAEKALTDNIDALERLNDRNHEQVQMLQKAMQALRDLQEGIPATRRMLLERCKTRERASV